MTRLRSMAPNSRSVRPLSSNCPPCKRRWARSRTRPSIRARRGIDQRAAGAFHGVGQHEHGGLLGLRLGARIAEQVLVDLAAVGIGGLLRVGAIVKVFHEHRAVVLLDHVDDRLRQMVLPGEVGAVLDVGDDHQRAHGGHEALVAAAVLALVLHEVARLEHLADVVEIGPHAAQQAAGADGVGGRLGDRAHGDRVVVGARRAADQLLQDGVGDVAQFQQAQIGEHAEEPFHEGQQARHEEPGQRGPDELAAGPAQQRPGPGADCRSCSWPDPTRRPRSRQTGRHRSACCGCGCGPGSAPRRPSCRTTGGTWADSRPAPARRSRKRRP